MTKGKFKNKQCRYTEKLNVPCYLKMFLMLVSFVTTTAGDSIASANSSEFKGQHCRQVGRQAGRQINR